MKTLEDHFVQYQRDGYTIFKQFLSTDQLATMRQQLDPIMARRFKDQPDLPRSVIPDALAHGKKQ